MVAFKDIASKSAQICKTSISKLDEAGPEPVEDEVIDEYEPIKQPTYQERKMKKLTNEAYSKFGNESLASVIKPSYSKLEKEILASKQK